MDKENQQPQSRPSSASSDKPKYTTLKERTEADLKELENLPKFGDEKRVKSIARRITQRRIPLDGAVRKRRKSRRSKRTRRSQKK